MENKIWEDIKAFYKNTFQTEEELVDIAANLSILRLCVSGIPVDRISYLLDISEPDIKIILSKYLGFPGWNKEIDFSPLWILNLIEIKTFSDYETMVIGISRKYSKEEIRIMYDACIIFNNLEKLLNEKWV